MRARIPLIVFPLLLLLLCALERFATFLLSAYPANPEIWRLWFLIRPAGYLASLGLDRLSGNDLTAQAAMLALAAAVFVFVLGHRKAVIICFLGNHFALVATAAAVFLTAEASTASLSTASLGETTLNLLSVLQFSPAQISLVAIGLISCAYCHLAFFSDHRKRRAHIELQLTALKHGL